ncbi:Stk1 family PASTA domain-containing Ser/Thr kinase [Schaalia sp. 19OD2882]|uniref:Stk1 family PASTA domain-containing Ser/Thr kinase n=1 Tax=Schaalia sp. 19OD2882 TaxID=2794089 RepID=UPI001C1ED4AF|nr:Stk1 family PASTA domain-containing Ser/Thr kinase [Schaalia sp. 19OD2882]QWW19613.1 Stk1 family PASTA domain-containing Ser/Thr kinase [Schaalia sp. 19OD2882]
MTEPTARRLGGRYEVRSPIGRGGMAEVHLGFDTRLSRVVAIKMLRTDLARDAVFQARFRREAQSAASLNHPNIVAVYDTGEEAVLGADGRTVPVPYIVMEYVEGHTVKDLLADGTPVPIDEAVEITSGVLSALEYAHSAHLVHRDIKPGNVMLTTQGKVKVMDFGIARALTDSQATMTQTNAVVGTAQYLSPEQARGEQVDTRSDLYSTGVLLFELLTGRPPFKGDSAVAVAYQHVQQLPPTPSSIAPDVPEPLDRIVMKALAKDREDRYPNASAMKADLIRLSQGAQVNAPATAVWAQTLQPPTDATRTMAAPPLPSAPTVPVQRPTRPTRPPQEAPVALADTNQEDQDPPSMTKRIVLIVVLVLAAVALAVGTWYAFGSDAGQSHSNEFVAVPDVSGKTQAEAKTALETAGFKVELSDAVPHDTIPVDMVAQTDPAAGVEVEKGKTVKIHLSSGPSSVTVPTNLVGLTPDEAKAAVEAAGLTWEVSTDKVVSDSVEEGKIVKTNPSPGQKVKAGTKVVAYLSSGTDKVTVPDVAGMTQEQARKALETENLTVGNVITQNHPSAPAGKIIESHPAAGESAKKGDQVEIVVSDGHVTIPTGLVGAQRAQVEQALKDLGLTVTITEVDNPAAAGTVLAMSTAEGSVVAQRASVSVTVSKGPRANSPQSAH